ncbi:MAG: bifunctional (p)ppGpp synthetase/guanosine-3',5'-bis(diphosphate) 3'-pyrophosphohydrolase [Acholeplasmataceae bacterium]|nr:bifunctional (p)ppGpp synthetase/guanosine-3',5'-bis(diphosphate) 3'-pyrophosphohydrolase [Acholeplasmataceae bacterium]
MEPATIESLLSLASTYLKQEKNIKLIEDAYNLAKQQHEGQFRMSGEPYINHPLAVAYMLTEIHAGPSTIAAALLHDVVEDTDISLDYIEKYFGSDVAKIVDGVTKISKLKYMTKEKVLEKSHQKILVAMAKDVRVILVKLYDRLHNMRTLEFQTPEKQKRIAQETLDLYAPLAHRLGMYRLKAELEDLSFKYTNPEEYIRVLNLIKQQKAARDDDIVKMIERLKEILNTNGFKNFDIKGRVKNIYSVCKKMNTKNKEFNEIYDLLALRIIVPTIEDCYHALGLVHGEWTPIPLRFKDYIATPKPNLYQSLHTTVVGLNGKIFEIQIRTYDMDAIAEMGIAAHWAYKEDNTSYTPEKEQAELASKFKWYKDMITYIENAEEDGKDPLENLKEDIFSANVYIFTPKGDVIDLPNGGTPLDFAYRVHTEVGNHTVGAIVNGKIVPLTYRLKTGDVVEIKTSKNFNGPTEQWIKIVKTSHAKHKIISILNKRKRDSLVLKGQTDFENALKTENLEGKITEKLVVDTFSKYNVNNLEDFYYELGKGTLSVKGAAHKLFGIAESDEEMLIKQYSEEKRAEPRHYKNSCGVVVAGLDKAQIKLANCCHPIKGDDIVGYVSKGSGIIVHRLECPNVKSIDTDRLLDVFWDTSGDSINYETQLSILSFDRKIIVVDIINTINSNSMSIKAISSSKTKDGDILTKVKVVTPSLEALQKTIANIEKLNDVYSVERIMK